MGTESRKREEKEEEELQKITTEEVRETIKRLRRKKAAGQYSIPNEARIFGQDELIENLKDVLNGIWKGGEVPSEWKTGIIRPIL